MFRSIAVLQKKRYHRNMKHVLFSVILGSSLFLASCSFREDLEHCPPLSAPIEGARAFVVTDELKQRIDVRLNGVRAVCKAEASGVVLLEIKAGMKITRDLGENAEADVAVVSMMTAVLDLNDNLLSNETFAYRIGFNSDQDRLLPVFEFELEVPADGRVVLSLMPGS